MKRRFLMHGIQGLYNYGCEAIVRGTVAIIQKKFPNSEIVYLSKRPVEDARVIADLPISVVDNHTIILRSFLLRLIRKALLVTNSPYSLLFLERFHDYRPSDVVLSIGGDVFTLPPKPYPRSFWDINILAYSYAKKRGAYLVLWGCSVGPFEDWPTCGIYYRKGLALFDLFTVREHISVDYLQRAMRIASAIVKVSDPAFMMRVPKGRDGGVEGMIGFNMSPLALKYASSISVDQNEFACLIATKLDRYLLKHDRKQILLIPHVWSPSSGWDNDYSLLRLIRDNISRSVRNRVVLSEVVGGAEAAKVSIAQCECIIAARMHCAIAAISLGIPTLLISYSAKSIGIAKDVFGDTTGRIINLSAFLSADFSSLVEETIRLGGLSAHKIRDLEDEAVSAGEVLGRSLESRKEHKGRKISR